METSTDKVRSNEMVISDELMLWGIIARDSLDIISKLAALLHDKGYVKDSFLQAVIKREKEFPTGLVTKTVPVAIPHADIEHVNRPALAIALLKEPVEFVSMEDHDQLVPVRLVMMCALSEPQAQIDFLRRFALAIQDEEFLPLVMQAESAKEACQIVRQGLARFNKVE